MKPKAIKDVKNKSLNITKEKFYHILKKGKEKNYLQGKIFAQYPMKHNKNNLKIIDLLAQSVN